MAVFDLGRRRLAVRVVYDGPAGAGKTTNVLTLSELLPLSRKLRDDGHRDGLGRTLTFDWEEIDSGVAAELPLACEILSVPGQAALAPRRRALLATADVGVEAAPVSSFISPFKTFDTSLYPSETTKDIAQVAYDSTAFLFDGSDAMPAEVGAGSFWKEMTAWVNGDQDLDTTLTNIDNSWPSD